MSVPDEAVEEQRCVANDASGTGLLVLAALQGQAIVHVTFGVQARLFRGGGGSAGGRARRGEEKAGV